MGELEQSHKLRCGSRERDTLASVRQSATAGASFFKSGLTHFRTSVGNKSSKTGKGQSAAAKYDYINREGKYAKGREEASYKETGNMPVWASENPRSYWEAADLNERDNGRVFVQAEFALPRDLSEEQQVLLAREQTLAMALTKSGQVLPYSFAIHDAKGNNPHFHIIISERPLDGQERTAETWFKRSPIGAKKTTDLQNRNWVYETRVAWCEWANKFLEAAGSESRLDHRTLKEQGIDRVPQEHVGYTDPKRPQMRQERQERNEIIKLANRRGEARASLIKAVKEEAAAKETISELTAILRGIEQKQPEIHAKTDEKPRRHDAGGLGAAPPVQGAERPGDALQQGKALPSYQQGQPGQVHQASHQAQDSTQAQPIETQDSKPVTQPKLLRAQAETAKAQPEQRETQKPLEPWKHEEGLSVHHKGKFAIRPIMDGSGQAELLTRQKDARTGALIWKPASKPCVDSPATVMQEAERRQERFDRVEAGVAPPAGYKPSQDEQGRQIAVHPAGLFAVRPENPGLPGQMELLARVDNAATGRESWRETGHKDEPLKVYAELGRQMELVKPGREAVSSRNAEYHAAGRTAPAVAQESSLDQVKRKYQEAEAFPDRVQRDAARNQVQQLTRKLTPIEQFKLKKWREEQERQQGRGR